MIGETIAERVVDAVSTYFSVFGSVTTVGLQIDDRWVGRPWDEYFEFVDARVRGGRVGLDLGAVRLMFTPVSVDVENEGRDLVIAAREIDTVGWNLGGSGLGSIRFLTGAKDVPTGDGAAVLAACAAASSVAATPDRRRTTSVRCTADADERVDLTDGWSVRRYSTDVVDDDALTVARHRGWAVVDDRDMLVVHGLPSRSVAEIYAERARHRSTR